MGGHLIGRCLYKVSDALKVIVKCNLFPFLSLNGETAYVPATIIHKIFKIKENFQKIVRHIFFMTLKHFQ